VKSRSFPLSRRRHCRPIAAVFTPIATKEFEYRRFWWNGALRNLIVERRWESDLTYLHFSRGVGSAPQTLFAVFYYFPAPPSSSSPSPPPALCSPLFLSLSLSHLSKKYHDHFNSRWYCRPIDEVTPGVILYFIESHVSHSYVVAVHQSHTCSKSHINCTRLTILELIVAPTLRDQALLSTRSASKTRVNPVRS